MNFISSRPYLYISDVCSLEQQKGIVGLINVKQPPSPTHFLRVTISSVLFPTEQLIQVCLASCLRD